MIHIAVKLYVEKTAITAADLLNDKVIPFFDEQAIPLLRVLTDRGTEYCGRPENHAYQLYLGIENIDHSKTKANSPQTNGICERFNKTMKEEFFDIAFRKKLYSSLEELQTDADHWLKHYNEQQPHSGSIAMEKPLGRPSSMQSLLQLRKILIPLARRQTTLLTQVSLLDNSHLSDQMLIFTSTMETSSTTKTS